MPVRIYGLQLDDGNEAECAGHGVTAREVLQVLDEAPRFFPNKRGHRAPLVMVGPTYGGRFLTVPLAPTDEPTIWRPATAWDASPGERARYDAARGARH